MRQRKPGPSATRWKNLLGLLGGLAALITAVAALLPALRQPSAPTEDAGLQSTLTAGDAEQLARRWIAALQSRDLDELVALSEPPFYMHHDITTSKRDIRRRYSAMLEGERREIGVANFDTHTVAEAKDAGRLGRDRLRSLHLEDTDFIVDVLTGKERLKVLVRRSGAALALGGVW